MDRGKAGVTHTKMPQLVARGPVGAFPGRFGQAVRSIPSGPGGDKPGPGTGQSGVVMRVSSQMGGIRGQHPNHARVMHRRAADKSGDDQQYEGVVPWREPRAYSTCLRSWSSADLALRAAAIIVIDMARSRAPTIPASSIGLSPGGSPNAQQRWAQKLRPSTHRITPIWA